MDALKGQMQGSKDKHHGHECAVRLREDAILPAILDELLVLRVCVRVEEDLEDNNSHELPRTVEDASDVLG